MKGKSHLATVTIILTSYNHGKFLRGAIESVINQTFADWELLIWDDVSTDDSWQIIESYSDPRIKAIRNERTRRYIYAINKTITERATGKYIAIHHSDDGWEPSKLERQVAYLESHPEVAAAFTHVQIIDEHNRNIDNDWFDQPNRPRAEWLRMFFLNANRLCHPSALVRKNAYLEAGLYKLAHAQIDDAEIWTRLLIRSEIHVIPQKLTRHRIFTDNSSVSGNKPTVRYRLQFEWFVHKENYLNLNVDEVLAIFPEAKTWVTAGKADSRFLLAMSAINYGNCEGTRLFGLHLLYKLLTNPADAALIEELHGFNYLSFFKLTGEREIFADRHLVRSSSESEAISDQKSELKKTAISIKRRLSSAFLKLFRR